MSTVQQINTPHGIIYIEVTEGDIPPAISENPPNFALPEGAELTGFKDRAVDTLKSLRANIIAVASEVNAAFAASAPEEWSVEVNIGFKGKVNPVPVIVSGEAEASLKVVAKWKRA